MFCERVKLYRMAGDSGEWKERGVGELKILRHNVTAKYRVLMRYSPQASSRLLSLSLCPSPPASSCLLSARFVLRGYQR